MIELADVSEVRFDCQIESCAPLRLNLNWWLPKGRPDEGSVADVDLGCLYETIDGSRGSVQAVGDAFGCQEQPPHIALRADDTTGHSERGEELVIARPDLVHFAVVFASVYVGAGDFQGVGTELIVRHEQLDADIRVLLASPDPGLRWCAILACGTSGGQFAIVHQQRYFLSARHADRHYGFHLDWRSGIKGASAD